MSYTGQKPETILTKSLMGSRAPFLSPNTSTKHFFSAASLIGIFTAKNVINDKVLSVLRLCTAMKSPMQMRESPHVKDFIKRL